MRLRNIPRAEGTIQSHQAAIKRPEDQKGCWKQVFGNENPIYIEIGMGKGRFLLNMAKQYPNVNFIGIERYSSVLLRALEKYLKTIKLKQNDRCRLVSKRKLLMPDSRKTRQWRAPSWI